MREARQHSVNLFLTHFRGGTIAWTRYQECDLLHNALRLDIVGFVSELILMERDNLQRIIVRVSGVRVRVPASGWRAP
jgi:hypothetical protein